MLKKGLFLYLLVLTIALGVSGCAWFGGGGGTGKQVTIGVTPWSTTITPSHAAEIILEEDLGYDVKLQEGDVGVIYNGLASGDIDIFLDAWLPHMHANYMEEYGDNIVDLSTVYTEGILGWGVPSYVTEVNSITDLKGKGQMFDSDGNGKGEIVGIDPGAGMMETSARIIEEYGLGDEYELIQGSEFAMMTALKKAYSNQEPIVFLPWRPHWMFTEMDLKFLEDPKGIWQQDEVHVLGHKGLDEYAPEAYRLLKQWKMPVEDLEQMIYETEVEGRDPVEVSREWVEANRDTIDEWVANAKK